MKILLKEYSQRQKGNIIYKLKRNVSSAIWRSIKGNKNGQHWESLLGYTLDELKKHLESQFTEGMNWNNYGKWHIDHIIPISVFNFSSPKHIDFKRCWSLGNLRPLWATENLQKHDKIDKDFQPSLAL